MACENIYKKTGKWKRNSGQSGDPVKLNSKQSFANHRDCGGGGANSAFEATIQRLLSRYLRLTNKWQSNAANIGIQKSDAAKLHMTGDFEGQSHANKKEAMGTVKEYDTSSDRCNDKE